MSKLLRAHAKFFAVAGALVALNVGVAATSPQVPFASDPVVAQSCPDGPKSDCTGGTEDCSELCSSCICWECEDRDCPTFE